MLFHAEPRADQASMRANAGLDARMSVRTRGYMDACACVVCHMRLHMMMTRTTTLSDQHNELLLAHLLVCLVCIECSDILPPT